MIHRLIAQARYTDAMLMALQLFADGNLSTMLLRDRLKAMGATPANLRDEGVDVIVDLAELMLEDNLLTKDEMDTLRLLKMYLGIREGDFLRLHKEKDIEYIISRQLGLIYHDKQVDPHEALMKVDLQELFGLSYDQYLAFERPATERAIEEGARVDNLDTFHRTK